MFYFYYLWKIKNIYKYINGGGAAEKEKGRLVEGEAFRWITKNGWPYHKKLCTWLVALYWSESESRPNSFMYTLVAPCATPWLMDDRQKQFWRAYHPFFTTIKNIGPTPPGRSTPFEPTISRPIWCLPWTLSLFHVQRHVAVDKINSKSDSKYRRYF